MYVCIAAFFLDYMYCSNTVKILY